MKGNVLKLRGIRRDSEWCDKDHVMLHACFQLLVDFIEQERPQTIVDYRHDRRQRRQWAELRRLYRYWKTERPAMDRRIEAARRRWAKDYRCKLVPAREGRGSALVVTRNNGRAQAHLRRLEGAFERTEDEMLRRLIAIRRHLWC